MTVGELPKITPSASISNVSLTGTMRVQSDVGCMADTAGVTGIFRNGNTYPYGVEGTKNHNSRALSIDASHTHTITIESFGENRTHNNIQPYIACYIWHRTA